MTNKHELGICECQGHCGRKVIAVGQQEVAPELKRRFAEWIDARTAKGIDTYGGPLTTNNGRDVQRDMVEELLDFAQYQQQRIMELEAVLQDVHSCAPSDYPVVSIWGAVNHVLYGGNTPWP